MSFILDALKKSETERVRQSGPALLEMRIVRPSQRLPAWAMIVGALLIASVAVLGWLAWRPASAPVALAPPVVVPAATSAPAQPAAAAIIATQPQENAAEVAANAAEPGTAESNPAEPNPADTEPAVVPDSRTVRSENASTGLHNYAELGGAAPELRLDMHVYAVNPAERYAFINMHKVHEGDVTPEGAQVRQITREGVVLEFRGSEFLLGRQ